MSAVHLITVSSCLYPPYVLSYVLCLLPYPHLCYVPSLQVCCGLNHTLAVSCDGMTAWAFGDGDYGKLGNGSNAAEMKPAVIEKLNGLGIIKIAAGTQFSVALSKSGAVYTWGQGSLMIK